MIRIDTKPKKPCTDVVHINDITSMSLCGKIVVAAPKNKSSNVLGILTRFYIGETTKYCFCCIDYGLGAWEKTLSDSPLDSIKEMAKCESDVMELFIFEGIAEFSTWLYNLKHR